jgi:hypothetical protein
MSKLSLFVVEHNRQALPDGRVVYRADMTMPECIAYSWQCVCRPEEKHDHQPFIGKLAQGIVNRNEVNKGYNDLVGQDGITDCNIQIHGPDKWVLYVSWLYENGLRDSFEEVGTDPLLLSHPDAIHDRVRKAISVHKDRLAAAAKAEAFAD